MGFWNRTGRDTSTAAERKAWRERAEQQMAEQQGQTQQETETETDVTPRHARG